MSCLHSVFLVAIMFTCCTIECLGILGGIPAQHYNFFVSVHRREILCGGTIVHSNAVVTSAGCLYDNTTGQFVRPRDVIIRKQVLDQPPVHYTCVKIIPHPFVRFLGTSADIVVLKLRECIDFEESESGFLKLCSASHNYPIGYALGLGWTRPTFESVYQKWPREVKLIRFEDCRHIEYATDREIREELQLCFGSHAQSMTSDAFSGIYMGDLGGPLVYKESFDSEPVCLIGVASFSILELEMTSVFTSASTFKPFIEKTIASFSATSKCEILK